MLSQLRNACRQGDPKETRPASRRVHNDDEAQELSHLVASLRYIDQKSLVPILGIVQSVAQLRETTPTIVKFIANTASTSSPYPPKDYKTVGKPRR
jgi:hypothetical protein